MKKNYLIVALIMTTFFVISFLTNILGALNPSVSASFDLNSSMSGFLPFSFFIAYGVMSIPAGLLLEKLGEKVMMISAFLLAFAGSMFFALNPSFSNFVMSLFTIGTGMAILQVVINPLLRVSGGEENYAFNSTMAQLFFGGASFVSPLVFSWFVVGLNKSPENTDVIVNALRGVVPENMTWVSMYWTFAAFSLLMISIIAFVKFPAVELQEDEKAGNKSSYINLLKNKQTILFFLGIFAYVGSEQGISYWMSKFLMDYHQINPEVEGANAVAYFWGLMTVGGMFGMVLLKVMDSKLVLKLFTTLAILNLGLALYSSAEVSYYSFMMSGFFLSVMYPIIMSLALNSVTTHHGSFAGILMTGIMGGAVVQVIVGYISDFTTLRTGMMFVFITLAYVMSIAFWAKPIVNNKTVKLKDIFK